MAPKTRVTKDLAPVTSSKSMTAIDDELSKEIANIKGQIGQTAGSKIKIESSGDFLLPDGFNLGNEIQVVVLDFVSRNFYYLTPWDAVNPAPPDCYALSTLASKNVENAIQNMAPEPDSPAVQSDVCHTCPQNAWGSASNNKAKACQNRRWLSVLLVDSDNPEAHNAPDAPVYTLDISPSNIKSFTGAVAAIARALNGPPIKAILTVRGNNVGTYAALSFVEPVPNPDYASHMARRAECADILMRKPDFTIQSQRTPSRQPARRKPAAPAPRR